MMVFRPAVSRFETAKSEYTTLLCKKKEKAGKKLRAFAALLRFLRIFPAFPRFLYSTGRISDSAFLRINPFAGREKKKKRKKK
ncbi:MAG: hypothetical protein J5843_04915, partial [Clostridia bacterium]|nr:hypothetical protein [Clostridia bacterium]